MKIKLLTVGKTSTPFVTEGIAIFEKRVRRYVGFEIVELPDLKKSANLTEAEQKKREGEAILAAIPTGSWVVLLDERGTEYSSRAFAEYLDKRMANSRGDIVFVVGGPYGFSEAVYARADAKISFSKMTFTHEMIRLFFVEQIYRAFTILRGEPYHHD